MLIKVKNNIDEIATICDEVKKFCAENNISEQKAYDIAVIIDELATNIISYAYDDAQEHTFSITLEKDSKQVRIHLVDDGVEFNPLQNGLPDLESSLDDRKIGGLGIFLVQQLSEKIDYAREEDQNKLDVLVNVSEQQEQDQAPESKQKDQWSEPTPEQNKDNKKDEKGE